jgi:hypothetical protein
LWCRNGQAECSGQRSSVGSAQRTAQRLLLAVVLFERDGLKGGAIRTVFVGYEHPWKIEEVHRQVKVDYDLERICMQRYDALKS